MKLSCSDFEKLTDLLEKDLEFLRENSLVDFSILIGVHDRMKGIIPSYRVREDGLDENPAANLPTTQPKDKQFIYPSDEKGIRDQTVLKRPSYSSPMST